ncbi:MAG TPA: tetratricopeptide repeat protein [Candidatus Acidoferrum sp.]|nr:tetratricopeptide repeat protein [Candidatus Acidoferrum sp.]
MRNSILNLNRAVDLLSSCVLFLRSVLLFVAIPAATLAGQTPLAPAEKSSAIEAHFSAAQQAQRDKDYAKAEREYLAVLALAPEFAEVHMNLGLVYQLEDRSEDAMTEFRRALKIKPALAGANFFLGVNYCKLGEGAKAIPYLRAALKAEPDRPDTWQWLASAQEIAGQWQAEVATLHRALELRPADVDLLYLLGSAYERLGKQEAAHLAKVAPGSSRSEQLLAESYASSNEWPSAVLHFQNALAASPDRPGLRTGMGEVYLHAGKMKQAIRAFDEELQRNPDSLRALVRRGEARLTLGSMDEALQDWQKAAEIDAEQTKRILGLHETGFGDSALEQLPDSLRDKLQRSKAGLQTLDSPAAHLALAFLAQQRGDFPQVTTEAALVSSTDRKVIFGGSCDEAGLKAALQREAFSRVAACAEKVFSQAISADLRIRVASALLQAGHPEAALKALNGLAAADAGSAEGAYWRARCYEKLATAAYLRLYQSDPDSYRVRQLMGDLEAARNDDGKAIEEYRAAIALKPSAPNLHYSLGHLLWKDLKVPEARVELEAELAMNPRHSGALNDLGNTFLFEHQPSKGLPYLLRALAANPGDADIHRDLGTAYSELGDFQKAQEHFKVAVINDRDGAVHYKLARAYQALGEKEKAAQEFAISTKLNRESHEKLEKQTERLGTVTKSAEDP